MARVKQLPDASRSVSFALLGQIDFNLVTGGAQGDKNRLAVKTSDPAAAIGQRINQQSGHQKACCSR
jgi:hypothetical protein